MTMPPFHLAFPVRDLEEARRFYGGLLGCPEGRSSPDWIDFDFHGHQIVAHLSPAEAGHRNTRVGEVGVVRRTAVHAHVGVRRGLPAGAALAAGLSRAGTKFIVEPHVRFKGLPGEQATMFFLDPSGNALEFKAFEDPSRLFAKQ